MLESQVLPLLLLQLVNRYANGTNLKKKKKKKLFMKNTYLYIYIFIIHIYLLQTYNKAIETLSPDLRLQLLLSCVCVQ